MASAFGHAAMAMALARWQQPQLKKIKFWLWMVAASILPDLDSIGFKLGVPYESMWGHRGFTHSILFAAIFAICVTYLFFSDHFQFSKKWRITSSLLFLSMMSHGILDAMTDGGLGVGFFIPVSPERYFFPFHPIKVSPISIRSFFTQKGWEIIGSELFWIGGLCLILILFEYILKKAIATNTP